MCDRWNWPWVDHRRKRLGREIAERDPPVTSRQAPNCVILGRMAFAWPDPISLIADVVTIIGLPAIVVTTWSLYREFRKERAERKKLISEGCLEFLDSQQRVAVNLVPLDRVPSLPRPGDRVFLPGEGVNYGAGQYEIESISFTFEEAPNIGQPCPAVPAKVVARVRRIQDG